VDVLDALVLVVVAVEVVVEVVVKEPVLVAVEEEDEEEEDVVEVEEAVVLPEAEDEVEDVAKVVGTLEVELGFKAKQSDAGTALREIGVHPTGMVLVNSAYSRSPLVQKVATSPKNVSLLHENPPVTETVDVILPTSVFTATSCSVAPSSVETWSTPLKS
jgi:hypothetical protein